MEEGEDEMQRLDGLLDTYQDKDEHNHHSQHSQQDHSRNEIRKPSDLPVRHEEKVQNHHSVNHIHEDINGEVEDPGHEEEIVEDYNDYEEEGGHTISSKQQLGK